MAKLWLLSEFWRHLNRRQKLKFIGVFLFLQTCYLLLMHNQLMDLFVEDEDFPRMKPINKTFEDLDAKRYLQDLLRGKAQIAPVVEKERTYELYLGCSVDNIQSIPRGWLADNRWYLYSAYEDRRPNSLYPKLKTAIQIIASTYYVVDDDEAWYCHVRNNDGDMIRVRAHFRLIWQRAWDSRRMFYNPYLITCAVPNDYPVYRGAQVILKGKKCPTGNDTFLNINLIPNEKRFEVKKNVASPVIDEDAMKIANVVESLANNKVNRDDYEDNLGENNYENLSQVKVAVCVKGMDFFEDKTVELLEWLLLQYALGADSVTLYIYHLNDRTKKMLIEVQRSYDLKLISLSLPGNVSHNDGQQHNYIWKDYYQKRRNELIPYNDCFYSYHYTHDYVLLVDTDEVVVPLQHKSWNKMISEFIRGFRQNATSLSVRNVFKFMNENDEPGLLTQRMRSQQIQDQGLSGKSFINTRTAATVFNHFALHRLHGNVARTAYFPIDWALKLHYKHDCPEDYKKNCSQLKRNVVEDDSLNRWNERIRKKRNQILLRVDS